MKIPKILTSISLIIASEAKVVTMHAKTDMEKVKAIYNHIVETVIYDKSGEEWGQGDALYACEVKRGNCIDFHSLFIGIELKIR